MMFLSPFGPFAETLIVAPVAGWPWQVDGKVFAPELAVAATLTSTWHSNAFPSVETCPPRLIASTAKVVGGVQVTVSGWPSVASTNVCPVGLRRGRGRRQTRIRWHRRGWRSDRRSRRRAPYLQAISERFLSRRW